MNQIIMKKIKITRLLPVLCGIVCFLYHPGAMAQTVVVATPVVVTNPVVTANVNSAGNAHIKPIINSAINANVNVAVNANITPEVNVDVNPEVNIDVADDNDHSEGSWFATIHGDRISIEFRGISKDDDDEHSWSNDATFNLS